MKIAIIAIGDELLIGQVTDTNSGMIARHIAPFGWELSSVQIAHDRPESISEAIDRAFQDATVVITTGGLGPTRDDITKQVLCSIFGGTLVKSEEVLDNIITVMGKRGLKVNSLTADQALVPSSCKVIQNRVGTAPIMWFEDDRGVLVAMPGVPFETQEMFTTDVFPALRKCFSSSDVFANRSLIVTGISESALAMHLAEWENSLPQGAHLAYLPQQGWIRLRLDICGDDPVWVESTSRDLLKSLTALVQEWLIYVGDKNPAEILLELLIKRSLSVATAESCTGGNIAHLITAIPGASEAMMGGIVAYSNHVKKLILGVSTESLKQFGAVSEPVALQMAQGAVSVTGADIAIATSGIAGPGGAVEGKPVGTVCIAVASASGTNFVSTFHFPGNRERVINRASDTGIILAIKLLQNLP